MTATNDLSGRTVLITGSSRGIGMGISLIVIFIYYVVMHTLTIVGEKGVFHAALMAWTPNILLYAAGIGFLFRSSR